LFMNAEGQVHPLDRRLLRRGWGAFGIIGVCATLAAATKRQLAAKTDRVVFSSKRLCGDPGAC
jgi:hypothetical protein